MYLKAYVSVAEARAFLADKRPDAYERYVDLLLKNPRYGEHQARYWLDAVRYGDTHGLHLVSDDICHDPNSNPNPDPDPDPSRGRNPCPALTLTLT